MNMDRALARLSVIVPVGPGDTLGPSLRSQLDALPRDAEVHVVHADEHAFDAPASAPGTGPHWYRHCARPGRAHQQNTGADGARGEWLWFLHADSHLAPGTWAALAKLLRANAPVLAYFDLRFLGDGPALMWMNTLGARIRSRWLGLPFGDQGLVLPRSVFRHLGGFDEALQYGEDHALVWQARRMGVRLQPLRVPIYTSARKYARHGWMRTSVWHLRETWRQARRFSRARSDA